MRRDSLRQHHQHGAPFEWKLAEFRKAEVPTPGLAHKYLRRGPLAWQNVLRAIANSDWLWITKLQLVDYSVALESCHLPERPSCFDRIP